MAGKITVSEGTYRSHYAPEYLADDHDEKYICIPKVTCRRREGGTHSVLRDNDRSSAGIYGGVFWKDGTVVAAYVDTKISVVDHDAYTKNSAHQIELRQKQFSGSRHFYFRYYLLWCGHLE